MFGSDPDLDDHFADRDRTAAFETGRVAVFGEENGKITRAEMDGGHLCRVGRGKETGVFSGVIRLGDFFERVERRPEDGLLAGLKKLDVNIPAVGLEYGLCRCLRPGGVALDERETVVAVNFVAADGFVCGKLFQKFQGGGKARR